MATISSIMGSVDGNQDIYKMSEANRGHCLLFLNQKFYDNETAIQPTEVRQGADSDIIQLRDIFTRLKFSSKMLENLSKQEIMNELDAILQKKHELEAHDSFVIIFSTHGDSSKILDKFNQAIYIDEITKKFSSKNCPGLIGKPKILIFLCCRGGQDLEGINPAELMSPDVDFDSNDDDDYDEDEQDHLVALYEDTIICYSTVYNHISLRYEDEGQIYGRYLAENLQMYTQSNELQKDFDYILKKTAQDMSEKDLVYNGKRQKLMSSVKTIGWRKYLYFNPDYPE